MDGTEKTKDASGETQDTSKQTQETSKAKMYGESEVQKIVNDRLAKAGRDTKATDARETNLKAREEAIALREREKEEEEYEKVRGNPAALTEYQRNKQHRDATKTLADERAAFEREKLEQQVTVDVANALTKEQGLNALAEKYKVNGAVLKDLDLDLEHTEKVAQKLSTLSAEDLAKLNKTPAKKERDSGPNVGGTGGEKSDEQRLKEMYPTMYK